MSTNVLNGFSTARVDLAVTPSAIVHALSQSPAKSMALHDLMQATNTTDSAMLKRVLRAMKEVKHSGNGRYALDTANFGVEKSITFTFQNPDSVDNCLANIHEGLKMIKTGWLITGANLQHLRVTGEYARYKKKRYSWDSFCNEVIGITRSYANRLINAYALYHNMAEYVEYAELPDSFAQLKALLGLDPEHAAWVFDYAYAKKLAIPTAQELEEAKKEIFEPDEPDEVNADDETDSDEVETDSDDNSDDDEADSDDSSDDEPDETDSDDEIESDEVETDSDDEADSDSDEPDETESDEVNADDEADSDEIETDSDDEADEIEPDEVNADETGSNRAELAHDLDDEESDDVETLKIKVQTVLEAIQAVLPEYAIVQTMDSKTIVITIE